VLSNVVDVDVRGQYTVLFPSAQEELAMLQCYHDCKADDSTGTSAVLIIPADLRHITALTRGMSKLATLRGTEFLDIGTCAHNPKTVRTILDRTYSVYYAAPAACCGVVKMSDLSEKLQLLCLNRESSSIVFCV
jgi:hypothetical protein